MKVTCIGGGPGGLYAALLLKAHDPNAEIDVYERNAADDTFGFGVVFSDATLDKLAAAQPETYAEIRRRFTHWDDIAIYYGEHEWRSTGHGFCGFSRKTLLEILHDRCRAVGVDLHFQHEITSIDEFAESDLIIAADGINSMVRAQLADRFQPDIDMRPNRFVWLGTTLPLDAFTFIFKYDKNGLWIVHAYQYEPERATWIVECTAKTWERSGLTVEDEDATVRYMEALFADELKGHALITNRSYWRQFPTIRNGHWSHENVVLIGDAVHTAHFSIGSGTKLAMEDAIDLAAAIRSTPNVRAALEAYEAQRRTEVDSLQRSAQISLEWFENAERHCTKLEPMQFAFSLLTRSLRISHANLQLRDPAFVEAADRWFAEHAGAALKEEPRLEPDGRPVPPMFQPFRLRDMRLEGRVVLSPMCQYSAEDGKVGDWHLVHLGSRAVGGAALVMTEMTDVSREGRISPGCAGMYAREHVDAWKRIVDFVHAESPAKMGIQLGHAGRKASTTLGWDGYDFPLKEGNWPILAPSPLPYRADNQVPREMTRDDMERVREQFVRAVEMSQRAGFDLVELHCAHGYLLSNFLSPLTNRRSDEYGGPLENRMRFPLEVFRAMRAAWPSEKPMSVRVSAVDWKEGGTTIEDTVAFCRALAAMGCDVIDVSSGNVVADQEPRYGRLFQTPFSERVREEVGIATITVGNVSTYEDVNSVLVAGRADLVAIARAHLFDPYWTRHAAAYQDHAMSWPRPYHDMESYVARFPDGSGPGATK